MTSTVLIVVFAILSIWLLALTFLLLKIRRHYHRLIVRTKRYTIDEVLDKLIADSDSLGAQQKELKKNLEAIAQHQGQTFQKIGYVRFNPFERVGGDQSFVIAILDAHDSGLVLNFLYTREGMRIYAKRVLNGASKEHELSSEEKMAIKKAS